MSLSRIWAVTPLLTFNGHTSGSFSFKKQLISFLKKSSHCRLVETLLFIVTQYLVLQLTIMK